MGSVQAVDEILNLWMKRHGLRVSDVYRAQFYYVDIIDDAGGRYEISVSNDAAPESIRVHVSSNRKKSCGFKEVGPAHLEGVLEKAYSRVTKWVLQAGGTKVLPADRH